MRSRMELDPEWEIKENSDEGSSRMKWMLSIGKKMTITGIVISSAPLVVPALVVFSAIGVVFSVPFGLVFAGYACTNKLITTILQPLQLQEYYTSTSTHHYDQSACCKSGSVDEEIEDVKETREQMEEDTTDVDQEDDDDEDAKLIIDIDKTNDSQKLAKGSCCSKNEEEGLGGDANDIEQRRLLMGRSATSKPAVSTEEDAPENTTGLNLNENLEGIYLISLEVPADENVHVDLSPLKPAPMDTKTFKKMPFREEINLDDEKMWEKIRAMRTIVGYKDPSQATCLGELKALYVFTGVEPPASFKDDSDLDEVNAKLKFLMAIVGVK